MTRPAEPAGPTRIRLAALDIAGTTLDEGGAVYRVLAEVARGHGSPATDADLRRWMGADKREAIAALLGLGGTPAEPDRVDAAHAAFVARLGEVYAADPPVPLPGVAEVLALLRGHGVAVALTTGFDRQVTDPLLAAVGWRVGEQLDAVVCADEVTTGRPAPDMIRRAMALTGVADPVAVLVAGDTALDVQAGLAAGAGIVVGVLTGAQTAEELTAAGPTHVLDGVHRLAELVLPHDGG